MMIMKKSQRPNFLDCLAMMFGRRTPEMSDEVERLTDQVKELREEIRAMPAPVTYPHFPIVQPVVIERPKTDDGYWTTGGSIFTNCTVLNGDGESNGFRITA